MHSICTHIYANPLVHSCKWSIETGTAKFSMVDYLPLNSGVVSCLRLYNQSVCSDVVACVFYCCYCDIYQQEVSLSPSILQYSKAHLVQSITALPTENHAVEHRPKERFREQDAKNDSLRSPDGHELSPSILPLPPRADYRHQNASKRPFIRPRTWCSSIVDMPDHARRS